MYQYNPLHCLPSSAELPDSDDTPVDSELQILIPNLLLVNGEYILQPGDKIWMPEIGLGMGRERGTYQGRTREWLFWYDENGNRYQTPEEIVATQQQQIQELLARLQQQDIDPNIL
ncbi:MAG: hypothetical protein QNJ36_20520 [Calothrix sp. MO_167.B42]|nr:hypothetical protein [Calothrix sp. MO_167.B42]